MPVKVFRMDNTAASRLPDLSGLTLARRWLLLLVLTFAVALILGLLSIPSQYLIGAMVGGMCLSICGGGVVVPRWVFFLAQAFIGCLIGKSISLDIVHDITARWPLFVGMVVSVTLVCTGLGWLLARSGTLPGTTAIWGTSPGAALIMTVMSQSYGADSRLVAFMQYLRLVMVTFIASGVAGIWGEARETVLAAMVAAPFDWVGFGETVLLAAVGTVIGVLSPFPSAAILFPMVVGPVLNLGGYVHIELPAWLMIFAYFAVGWGIGARFDRPIVVHALRALPRIFLTMLTLIAICGGFAVVFGHFAGIDPMTAYLATSPGGMDTIAIITTSIGGNTSLIMAVQTTRFLLVNFTSPTISAFVARRGTFTKMKDSGSS